MTPTTVVIPTPPEVEAARKEHDQAYTNAARIVACVNACAGIRPSAIPELIELRDEWENGNPMDASDFINEVCSIIDDARMG